MLCLLVNWCCQWNKVHPKLCSGERLQYDRKFKGPLSKRSCTDVFCLLIFVIFLAAWGYIGHYAVRNGDLNKLLVPTDSFNRKCGVDAAVKDKKYLFFFNLEKCIDPLVPITGCPTPQVCVSQCPTETFVWDNVKNKLSVDDLKQKLICQTDAYKSSINSIDDAEKAILSNRCARWYVKSKPFGNRCIWDFAADTCENIPLYLRDASLQSLKMTPKSSSFVAFPTTENSKRNGGDILVKKFNNLERTNHQLREPVEEIVDCGTRYQLGEVIKQKVQKSNSYVTRLTGNLIQHFYKGENAQQVGEKVVEDIISSWPTIFLVLVVTMAASLIFIALMRWVATPLVWLSILGVLVGLGFGVYFSIGQYKYWKNTTAVPNHSLNLSSTVKNIFQDAKLWLYASIILGIVFVVIFLLVIVLRSRIRIAVALVKEGSKAVSCVVATVFFPIFPWFLFMCTISISVVIGLFLASVGDPSFIVTRSAESTEDCRCEGIATNYTRGAACDPVIFQNHCFLKPSSFALFSGQNNPCIETGCFFEGIGNPKIVSYFQIYNFIGFLWLSFFISALGEMVLAATFATWYWTFHKSDVPYFVLSQAFGRTVRYHLGTVALGAFILTICRFIRVVLEYIDQKLKKFDNSVTRGILCCMKCFFWCLENFLRFINKNAYIMCAIHGKNFCASAKDSFNLLMRNFLRVIAVDKVTDFLFFLSKLLLTGAAGVGTYYYFENTPTEPALNYIAVPITIVVIATFLITSVFFGVYSMAVDTLFLCFLEDCERNDGSEEKPYFMSKQLMKILRKRNKMPTP
ncbi:choline transporter-like 2 isoform X2 [Eupeodes corollae]|uniref:choline transporter-like 2 isoform X2 n=1 Tax=Eupeodes corollae TaxID=290404 RepID=UPI002492B20A|nr:choline transporter-like 2 isoform X2 [Eupeodes corollae]